MTYYVGICDAHRKMVVLITRTPRAFPLLKSQDHWEFGQGDDADIRPPADFLDAHAHCPIRLAPEGFEPESYTWLDAE